MNSNFNVCPFLLDIAKFLVFPLFLLFLCICIYMCVGGWGGDSYLLQVTGNRWTGRCTITRDGLVVSRALLFTFLSEYLYGSTHECLYHYKLNDDYAAH